MSERCENCGNPVLATDTVCWHCGRQLPKRPHEQTPSLRRPALSRLWPTRAATEHEETAAEAYDLRAVAIYGALTLLILLALLAMMRSLGRQPLLVASADLRLGADWTAVTDNNLRYTLSLPPGWQWIDGAFRQQQGLIDDVADDTPNMRRSLSPLGDTAGDLELLAISFQPPPENEELTTFVVIGRSPRLGQITPQQALDLLAEQSLLVGSTTVAWTDIVESIPGQEQARFGLLDSGRQIQCRSLFIAERSAAYVVAACAPQESFGRIQRDLENILDSFQLLQH